MYTANPHTTPDAKKIECIVNVHEWVSQQAAAAAAAAAAAKAKASVAVAAEPELSGKWGTGGMATKIQAARYTRHM